MIKPLLLVSIVVTVLPCRSLTQDTSKRHISESGDNLTSKKVGPALRQFQVEPVFHRLDAEVVGNVTSGEDVSLRASLPDENDGVIRSCVWTSPEGDTFAVEKETIRTEALEGSADGIVGNVSDVKNCHITIRNIKEKHFGTWKCKIVHSKSKKFQEAFLTVTPTGISTDVRLPKHLNPDKYKIYLTPFIEEGNFTIPGHVDISLTVVEAQAANNVTLHIEKIDIYENTVKITKENEDEVGIEGFGYDKENHYFIIFLSETLQKGEKIDLSIDFLAELNADLSGFYRSKYFDEEKNQTEYIATTQFESIGARRALPCFDEPGFKSVFQVNLGRLKDMRTISNMPAEYEDVPMADNNEYMWDIYQDSPVMSTYLLAFIVSRFTYRQSETLSNGVQFRIWSRRSVVDQTELAAKVGPSILEFFERHYNVKFPLPKMDMIAIPDFSAGAMENWGLITYRETALLFKEGETSMSDRESIIATIAHELAHQWFGNLVTMEWWTDLWLNEGFANYMQYLGSHHASDNNTDILDIFVIKGVQAALERDSIQSSHPVSVPVNHPSEISEIFDEISYKKGGSIIRMMANFLGQDVFNRGIEEYLKKHKYGNAKQDDLWASLTEVAHARGRLDKDQTLKEIMDTWTVKMGYPVITVNRSYAQNPKELSISQERFLLSDEPGAQEGNDKPFRWWVPVSYTTPAQDFINTKNSVWLSPEENSKVVSLKEGLDEDQPVIVNIQQTGFYRVNYDSENWKKISKSLMDNHKKIHRTNRAQILDDSLTLARAGLLDYKLALETTEYLADEVDYIPWSAAIGELSHIGRILSRTAGYGAYKEFMIRQLLPIYQHLSFVNKPTDSSLDVRLREDVINVLCKLGHDDCEEKAVQLFRKWIKAPEENSLPADIRYTIYCTAISSGKESDWNFLWNRFQNVLDSPSEKSDILSALTCTKEIWILQKLLDLATDVKGVIRKQDSRYIISGVANNKVGRDLAWNWLRGNWAHIYNFYKSGSVSSAGSLIATCASTFNNDFELQELEEFYRDKLNELGSGKRSAESAIQKTKANVKWMREHYEEITGWLEKKNEFARNRV